MRERQKTRVGSILKRKCKTSIVTKILDIFTYSILLISLWSRFYHYSYFTIAETEARRDVATTQCHRELAGLDLRNSDSRTTALCRKLYLKITSLNRFLFYVVFHKVDEVRASRACHLDTTRLMCWSIIRANQLSCCFVSSCWLFLSQTVLGSERVLILPLPHLLTGNARCVPSGLLVDYNLINTAISLH